MSTQPSTLCGMVHVKWVSVFGLSNSKWRWWMWFPPGGPIAQVRRLGRLGPKVGSRLALFCIHRVNRVNSSNDSSVFRCALKVVMVTGEWRQRSRQLHGARCRDTECFGWEVDPCRWLIELTGGSQSTKLRTGWWRSKSRWVLICNQSGFVDNTLSNW